VDLSGEWKADCSGLKSMHHDLAGAAKGTNRDEIAGAASS